MLGVVDRYFDEYEEKRIVNVGQASDMKRMVDKYVSNATSFFEERRREIARQQDLPVRDLLTGMFNLTDDGLVQEVLELMREQDFVRVLDAGIKNISKTVTAFSLRMEKKITDLKLFPKENAPDKLPALMNDFIERQEHIVKTTLKSLLALLRGIADSMPKESRRLAGVSERMLERLGMGATLEITNLHRRLLSSRGADACSAYTRFTQDTSRMRPLITQALSVLPMVESVARAKVPEVAADVRRLAQMVQASARKLQERLGKDLTFLRDGICSLTPKLEPVQLDMRGAQVSHQQ